VPIG